MSTNLPYVGRTPVDSIVMPVMPSPGAPPTGTIVLYADQGTGVLTALNSAGQSVLPSGNVIFGFQSSPHTVTSGDISAGFVILTVLISPAQPDTNYIPVACVITSPTASLGNNAVSDVGNLQINSIEVTVFVSKVGDVIIATVLLFRAL